MHLRHYSPGRDEETERDVDPMRLLVVEGRTYLEGWCRRAEGVRLFRLDRVLSVDVLDVPAEVPENAEPVDVDAGLFTASPSDVLVELELAPAGRWVAEYYPCDSAAELADGWLRIALRTPDTTVGAPPWHCASARTPGCCRPPRSRTRSAPPRRPPWPCTTTEPGATEPGTTEPGPASASPCGYLRAMRKNCLPSSRHSAGVCR